MNSTNPLNPKDAPMLFYKTIVLELLQQHSQMYDQLLSKRHLLPMLNLYASQLRDSHLAWKDQLSQAKPDNAR